MPDQLPNEVKERRSREAIAVAREMSLAYRQAMVGTVVPVLFEQVEGGLFAGHAPNYVKVYADCEGCHNQIRNVEVTNIRPDGVLGHVIS